MTDQDPQYESNQGHQGVTEGAVQPSMAGEEQNPPKNKDKEAYVLGDSLLSNNDMKPEKRFGSTIVLSIALVLATIYLGWSLLVAIAFSEWTIMLQLHFLCIIIATLLLWNGKTMGNRISLYTWHCTHKMRHKKTLLLKSGKLETGVFYYGQKSIFSRN